MRWIRLFISSSVLLLSILLFPLFYGADVSATSVSCSGTLPSSFNPGSGFNYTSNCDLSSLSSGRWYYYFSFSPSSGNSSTTNSVNVCFAVANNRSCSSTTVSNNDLVHYLVNDFNRYASNPSFSYFFTSSSQLIYLISNNISFSVPFTYSAVISDVNPFVTSDCPPLPSGSFSISSNGEYDISDYASVSVDVPQTIGPISDDSISKIIFAIFCIPATILVVYFFYCIYRMIIKSTGGWS